VSVAKAAADKLYKDADDGESVVRAMALKLDKTGGSMSFEARIKARKEMLAKKDEAAFLREQATAATVRYQGLKKEMESIVYADTVTPLDFEEMEGIREPRIESWVLCQPLKDGGLGAVYYGAFAGGQSPPAKGWVTVHDGADVNSEPEEFPQLEFKGPPARMLKERLEKLKEREAALARGEEPPPVVEGGGAKTVLSWMVSGATVPAVNGRSVRERKRRPPPPSPNTPPPPPSPSQVH
jgi:hypothetical protein